MNPAELADIVDRLGVVGAVVLVLLAVFWLWANVSVNSQERAGRMSEAEQAELIQLRKDYKALADDKFLLEQKFTACREELAHKKGQYELLEAKNQSAVDKFLDDTQDLDREMLLLRMQIKDKDALIANKDTLIALLEQRLKGEGPNV